MKCNDFFYHFDNLYYNCNAYDVHANNSGITLQHKAVHTIKHHLNKDFTNLYKLFVDNTHLGEDKRKCILLSSK